MTAFAIKYSRTIKNRLNLNHKDWKESIKCESRALMEHEINAMMLLSIESPLELVRLLKTSFFKLEEMINSPFYERFYIRKKAGGLREIIAPGEDLKKVQKQLNYFLQAYYLCLKPKEVTGFVINPNYLDKSCNIFENAKAHIDKKHILNVDLLNFFPSISAARIKELFLSNLFQFNRHIAEALALLVTYNGYLPIGAPTSPAISNFVCFNLDRNLKSLANYKYHTYTRYADDITFSSDYPFTKEDLVDIEATITTHGFSLNHKKTRIAGANRRQTVTGLVVNRKVNVQRQLLKKIRAVVHDCKTNGIDHAAKRGLKVFELIDPVQKVEFFNHIMGYINFIGQVRGTSDKLYLKLKEDFVRSVDMRNLYS